jgi:hypothetical protein
MSFLWTSLFFGRAEAASTNYPHGAPRDRTPGNSDGTPITNTWLRHLAGFEQRALTRAGITPNGNLDTALTSQLFEALQKSIHPPGTLCFHSWASIPAGYRLLNLEGQGIDRTAADYVDLDAACYVGDTYNDNATAFYRADDAGGVTRNTVGQYLILPDARGCFVRGVDLPKDVDKDRQHAYQRLPGNVQGWAMRSHGHVVSHGVDSNDAAFEPVPIRTPDGEGEYIYPALKVSPEPDPIDAVATGSTLYTSLGDSGDFPTHQSNYESRPINVAAYVAIWY